MTARISTVSLKAASADRARTLANLHGVPVGSYLADLIDRAYSQTIGPLPSDVTVDGDVINVALGDDTLALAKSSAAGFAGKLREIATQGGSYLDMDHPAMVSIGRTGGAVVIETRTLPLIKHRMGETDAKRLALEIEGATAK